MKTRRMLTVCFVLLAWAAPIWAQSNSVIDDLLAQTKASYGDAVYMALAASKQLPDTASIADALAALDSLHWGIKVKDPKATISLGDYSYLLMRAFKMRGGVMYSLLPGPRYAARELAYLNLVYGDPSPYRVISGRDVVQILGNVMNYTEAHS